MDAQHINMAKLVLEEVQFEYESKYKLVSSLGISVVKLLDFCFID